ncbi:GntR family transcriptional regulator [Vagococcus fluvialis]|uniref:GntR family transcriptional regulator n=1 Tax=Vagococcus fluvialis TaxID=2738 RepID=UPI0037AAD8F1
MKNKKILYQEVSDSIKKDIIEGKYPLNTYVPTEIELEKMFDVSKITVRKAIQILCNEGYLVKQSGKGTEVISNRPFNILSKASSFTTVLEKQGNVVTKSILSVEETDLVTDMTFKHDRVIEITRLFEIKEEPAIFFKHYISVPKKSDLNSIQTENFSLYAFMASIGTQISYIDDQFSAVEATEEVKNRLELSKEFVLKRVRQSFDKDNQLVEYTVAFYDSDKQPYIIDYEV